MKKMFQCSNVAAGILFTLFFISLGVWIALNFRPLYKFDIKYLNIVQESGLSQDEILENYNALIDYCSPFYHNPLTFPTLPASEEGIRHFTEVKVIFNLFFYMGLGCFILLIPVIVYKIKKRDPSFLLFGSLTAIILPIIAGIGCALNFNTVFVLFHKIFFNNDDWLFDPTTDPVINILPETFFLHCALLIIGTIIAGSLLLFILYWVLRNTANKK